MNNNGKKWIIGAIIALAVLIIGITAIQLRPSAKPVVLAQNRSMDNQQLYDRYAPSVVLIQHRFMYRITAGEKKYFFNEFYSYDDNSGFLRGLTEDSLAADNQASPIQGTGFFVSSEGKLLTNRHVVKAPPTEYEKQQIRESFLSSLEGAISDANYHDSLKRKMAENDSLLIKLLADSVNNVNAIADLKEKIWEMEEFVDEGGLDESIRADSATLDLIKNLPIAIDKINLELRIFPQGTSEITSFNGIGCNVIAISKEQDVDLALIQTSNKELPDTTIKMIDLSRIGGGDRNQNLQISEKLILIGYNRGSDLAQTTEGIQPQLTDGKVSQNNDAYKLMYTIPTLPGSSGSPVMDEKGRLVSVNFAGVTETQNFNYGIQLLQIRKFLTANRIEM